MWLNVIFLMCQSFIPFPTVLMGEYASNLLAVRFSGCGIAINTIAFIAMHKYILRHAIKPGLAEMQGPHIVCKSFIGVVSYVAGTAVAWYVVGVAFAVCLFTP